MSKSSLALGILLVGLSVASPGFAADKTHVVAAGHTLGKIAKRYHVTVDALCEANGIDRRARLKPGMKLVIPDPTTKGDSKEDDDSAESCRRL